jgi:hypothetical protein
MSLQCLRILSRTSKWLNKARSFISFYLIQETKIVNLSFLLLELPGSNKLPMLALKLKLLNLKQWQGKQLAKLWRTALRSTKMQLLRKLRLVVQRMFRESSNLSNLLKRSLTLKLPSLGLWPKVKFRRKRKLLTKPRREMKSSIQRRKSWKLSILKSWAKRLRPSHQRRSSAIDVNVVLKNCLFKLIVIYLIIYNYIYTYIQVHLNAGISQHIINLTILGFPNISTFNFKV